MYRRVDENLTTDRDVDSNSASHILLGLFYYTIATGCVCIPITFVFVFFFALTVSNLHSKLLH